MMNLPRPGRQLAATLSIVTSLVAFLGTGVANSRAADPTPLVNLKAGDHVCLIGGTLAEMVDRDGWLETLLQHRFPQNQLMVRGLGYAGDEVALRLRYKGFGEPDDYLRGQKADVILAMFGYGESFGGEEGLGKFKHDLQKFIDHTLATKYNDHAAPQLVLFSPIAHENIHDPNLPDGVAHNADLKLYTAAMAEVAKEKHVPFVDLFTPSQQLFAEAKAPLTSNGVHLTMEGNRQLATVIDRAMFGPMPGGEANLDKLHAAVLDKDFYWFNHYRTTDGYSILGGRADMAFVGGQTNRVVMAREMEVLDVLAANRDRRIWAIAAGSDYPIDDSNTPPFIEVVTNKPGPLPGGKHKFLGGEEAIGKMKVAPHMKVTLFASEEMFPEASNPVQMAFDTKGRLWVAAWPSYPHWKPKEEMNDKLLILEDTDGDGRADKVTTFADHLHNPTGFEFWNGGVLVAMAPDVLFLKDTNGDDHADERHAVIHGIDSADTHHTANSFTLGPGGSLFFQEGTFHHTQVETPYGMVHNANAGVYRYDPRRQAFDVYVAYNFANPHGHVFDRWGQDIITDATSSETFQAALFSGHTDYPKKHSLPPTIYHQRTRPCPAIEILSSEHFPAENQGNLLVGNVIGFQGILQYKLHDQGGSFGATEVAPIVSSSDPNFRPADIEIGPDGAIWFTDWQNPIIGHLQHNLRDPNRDRTHGRIYRVTYDGRPLSKSPEIAGQSIEKLLDLLKHPEARVRYRARIELSGRKSDDVIAALDKWVAALDPKDAEFEHNRLEGLWMYSQHNRPNAALLAQVLASPDFHARAAATRQLCDWRDSISTILEDLKKLAADPHPRVRIEAVRAASFLKVPEAVEVAAIAGEQPHDDYVDFVRGETLRTLRPYWDRAIARNRLITMTTPAGAHYLLHSTSNSKLLQMPQTAETLTELVGRPKLKESDRASALAALAKLKGQPESTVALAALTAWDNDPDANDQSVLFELTHSLKGRDPKELTTARPELERLATGARRDTLRQVAFATLVGVDGSADKAWVLAGTSASALEDFLASIPLITDGAIRSGLYDRVAGLLDEMPTQLAESIKNQKGKSAEVRHEAMFALAQMRGQESKAFPRLAKFIYDGSDRTAAVRSLRRISRAEWPKDQAGPLVASLMTYIRTIPPRNRNHDESKEAMELVESLATLLPPEEASHVRADLGKLGVRIVRLGTLLERMAYDKETLAVAAGKPVEFRIENVDLMPHNFVIVQPGAMEEVGVLAEATAFDNAALDIDAPQKQFVPKSDKVLISSALVQPRETQKVTFMAPKTPGVYPYICTYPGHWRRMFGALYVVEDLDAYLAAPEAYLAAHPLEIKDEPLKQTRPRTEWKYEDLAEAVGAMDHGRSFSTGKQLFTVANCIACHKLDGAGLEFGPDLSKLDKEKFKPLDILRDVLEPSHRIEEKYQTWTLVLDTGQTVTGLILEDQPTGVKIVENPITRTEPRLIPQADIEFRKPSDTSLMPKGLLDKLSREEILDLVAFVIARGDKDHALFQGSAHDHEHGH